MPATPSAPTPLSPSMHAILLALLDQERHGYAIMQEVEALTAGDMRLGPATLYGSIKKLVDARLVEESGDRPDPDQDDERRRYYRLTAAGREAVKIETRRLERLVRHARPHLRREPA